MGYGPSSKDSYPHPSIYRKFGLLRPQEHVLDILYSYSFDDIRLLLSQCLSNEPNIFGKLLRLNVWKMRFLHHV